MQVFHLFEDNIPESLFRFSYGKIEERVGLCCRYNSDCECCANECRYLIAFDIEATKNGYPSVFGVDCDVEVLCWGGHADETTVNVFCESCADARHRFRIEKREKEEQELAKRRALGLAALAQKARTDRRLRDHWWNLSAIPFETECAQLFRSIGFEAKITARTNDGNIDIIMERDRIRGAAQCKAWNQPCGVKTVREFIGTIYSEDLRFDYLIAKSGFTPRARLLLRKIKIVEGWDLSNLVQDAATVSNQEPVSVFSYPRPF